PLITSCSEESTELSCVARRATSSNLSCSGNRRASFSSAVASLVIIGSLTQSSARTCDGSGLVQRPAKRVTAADGNTHRQVVGDSLFSRDSGRPPNYSMQPASRRYVGPALKRLG